MHRAGVAVAFTSEGDARVRGEAVAMMMEGWRRRGRVMVMTMIRRRRAEEESEVAAMLGWFAIPGGKGLGLNLNLEMPDHHVRVDSLFLVSWI